MRYIGIRICWLGFSLRTYNVVDFYRNTLLMKKISVAPRIGFNNEKFSAELDFSYTLKGKNVLSNPTLALKFGHYY